MNRLIGILSLVFTLTGISVHAYTSDTLYDRFHKQKQVSFFVQITENKSSLNESQVEYLKQSIVDKLVNRKSIRFVAAPLDRAAIHIEVKINEYLWTEEDPIDMITSAPLAIYDAATNEHYSRIMAQFVILETKTEKIIWKESVKSTVSDATMTELEGFNRAVDELGANFIAKAFKKQKK